MESERGKSINFINWLRHGVASQFANSEPNLTLEIHQRGNVAINSVCKFAEVAELSNGALRLRFATTFIPG